MVTIYKGCLRQNWSQNKTIKKIHFVPECLLRVTESDSPGLAEHSKVALSEGNIDSCECY